MREEIRIRFSIGFDAPAELPLTEQAESARNFLADVLANAMPGDTATGSGTLYSLEPVQIDGDPLPEAEIYGNNGRTREARTRRGFDSFTVQRVRETTDATGDSHVAPCGWTDARPAPGNVHGPVFWSVYARRDGSPSVCVGDFKTRAQALLMADGRAVDCPDSMFPGFRVTWETVTKESAGHGDADARGFVCPVSRALEPLERVLSAGDGETYAMPLRDAQEALCASPGTLETLEANDSDPSGARWVTAHFRRDDYGAGDVISESRSIHFPENLTPASRVRLVKLICK